MSGKAATSREESESVFTLQTLSALIKHFVQWQGGSPTGAPQATGSHWLCDLRQRDIHFNKWLCQNTPFSSGDSTNGLIRDEDLFVIADALVLDSSWRGQGVDTLPESRGLQDALLAVCKQMGAKDTNSGLPDDDDNQKTVDAQEEAWRQKVYNFAYGLSHELNNPLANISTRAGVLLSRCETPQDRELLAAIVDSAMRGCEMLGDLMLIARPPKLNFQPANLSDELQTFAQRVQTFASDRGIEVNLHIAENAPAEVNWDSTAISESLWCLCRNAIECQSDAGQVTISVRGDARDEFNILPSGGAPTAAPKLIIEISDNGPGLSEEAAQQCFDIYYSGRESGRGLGIGLAKAERIVTSHQGKISIGNRTSGGVSVIVLLPSRQS